MRRHAAGLAAVFAVAAAIYGAVTGSFFCGYDAFLEVHRTAFEDTQHPSRIFTTSHFDSPKYRPLERLVDYATYHAGKGSALAFRLRSLLFHLVTSAEVYGIALLLFDSVGVAFAASLLFAVHPLANQSVVACSWPITPAGALTMGSLLMFLRATRSEKGRAGWLATSLFAGWIALFYYESSVAVFGLMYGYLAFVWFRQRKLALPPKFLVAMTLAIAVFAATLFAARAAFIKHPPERADLATIAKNAAMFGGALLAAPADSVLANDLAGTPLPSQMDIDSSAAVPVAGAVAVLAAAEILLLRARRQKKKAGHLWTIGALIAGAGICLSPFLVFNPHPSETYLYLPAALCSIATAAFLRHTLGSRGFAVAVGILAVVFAAATFDRNERVAREGAIAKRIMDSLPLSQWKQGPWDIRLAEADPPLPRFGIYSYQGLATIDLGAADYPAQCALQLMTGNQGIQARVMSPEEMRFGCPQGAQCFFVRADGSVFPPGKAAN